MEYTQGKWEVEHRQVIVHNRGVIANLPLPTSGGVFEYEANAHLIAQSPRMAKWITKVASQDFVVFPEDKTVAKEIIQTLIKGGIIKMDTNSNSQKQSEGEGQTGCEACIKKDEIITALYEALKVAHRELLHAQWEDGLDQVEQALSKVEGG